MEQDESVLDFREIIWKARRYKWLVLLPIVLLLCAASTYLMLTPPLYESSVVVSVDDNTPVSRELGSIVNNQDGGEESRRRRVERVDSKIHSRPFLEAIVVKAGYANHPKLLERAAEIARQTPGITAKEVATRMAATFLGKLIIVTPSRDLLVRIAARSSDPKSARNLAQMITDEVIAQNQATSVRRATERGEFSADQIAVYEERLTKSEAALRNYEQSVIGRRLTGTSVNEGNYDTAKQLISEARAEQDQIRSRLQTDLSAWQNSGGVGAGPPALRNSRTAELESRLGELETSYGLASMAGAGGTGRGADVEGIKLKIGGVRQSLYTEYQSLASGLDNLSSGARDAAAGIALDRAELRSLKQKETRLSRMTSDYSRSVVSKPTEDLESERLRTEVQANRDLLLALKKEATSSRISAALETSQLGMEFQIQEPPQLPLRPVYPDPVRILGIALFIGPLLGVGAAVVAERFGAALRSLEQAEKEIGARVIGTMPRIEGWSQPGGYVQKYWPVISIALVIFATAVFYTLHVTVLKQDRVENVQPKP